MKAAYKDLVRFVLANGSTVSVYDGEEFAVKRSRNFDEIIGAIEAVEEAEIVIRSVRGENIGWALIIPFGVSPDETVADFTDNILMNNWFELYESENS